MSWLPAAAYIGGTLLDMWGTSEAYAAEIEYLTKQAAAAAADAEAIDRSLTDEINEMERQIYRGIGSARANIGASGVSMRGSAMDALIQMHRVGREEMEAAFHNREVEVNRKYLEAINFTRQAKAKGRVAKYELAGKVFSAVSEGYQYRNELGFN